jgi:hypothetical protein
MITYSTWAFTASSHCNTGELTLLALSRGTSYKDMGRKKSSTAGSTSYKVSNTMRASEKKKLSK